MSKKRKRQQNNKNNLNRKEMKARVDSRKRQALASSRQNFNKNKSFFEGNKNIHSDVKTTYKKRENVDKSRRKNISFNRISVIAVTIGVFLLFIYYAFVLFDAQVLQFKEMTSKANSQYYRKMVLPAKRGDIYDRNGRLLVTTKNVFRIGLTPEHVYSVLGTQTETEIANQLASILKIDENELIDNLGKKEASYIQIADKVSKEQADLLDQYLAVNQIGGVRIDAEPERVYYNGEIASQIIGFASGDENGLTGRLGVEYQLNEILNGSTGYSYAAKDNYLNAGNLPFSQSTELASQNGNHVYLTIDYEINKKLQEHVKSAVDSLGAQDGGTGIVLNVKTGEILAMASYPYFSSADPAAKPLNWDDDIEFEPDKQETIDFIMEHYWKNKTISTTYEVGSTFKAVTLALGLEENVASEEKMYSDAPIQIADYTIGSWRDNMFGQLPLQDAFLYSFNPPFVRIALDIGVEKYYSYIDALGLTHSSGVELPGEVNNIFHVNPSEIDLATLSFGEQSSMNLMSYSKAFSSIVNGGNLMKPTVVKQITNDQGAVVSSFEPIVERRVISEKTSERVAKMLSRNDTLQGLNRVSAGYELGGKTSTSVNETTNALTLSYVGLAPMSNPEILVLIVGLNSTTPELASNSLVNNVSGMMDFTLDRLNIERNYTDEEITTMTEKVAAPELIGLSLQHATDSSNYRSINVIPATPDMQSDDYIAAMLPLEGTSLHYGSNVYVYPEGFIKDLVAVPDFTGKNFNECMLAANEAGVTLNFEGDFSGLAASQVVTVDYSNIFDDIEADNQDQDDEKTDNNQDHFVQRGSIINIVLESVSAD